MSIWVVTPADNLSRDVATRNLLWLDSTENEYLKPQPGGMFHEHFDRLRRRHCERFLVVTSNKNFFNVRNPKLHCSNCANAFVLEFPKPLVRKSLNTGVA